MAKPAVARDVVRTLRHQIAKIEGKLAERLDASVDPTTKRPVPAGGAMLRTGVQGFDDALGGGLPVAGLLELHGVASRDSGAAAGFALALTRLLPVKPEANLLWIGTSEIFREAGRPYAPGLAARFGLAGENLLIGEAEKLVDVLWIAEEAARVDAFLAVLLEIRGSPRKLDLTATRRLHRRALVAGVPLFLIREAGEPEPTAAPVRLLVAPAPASTRATLAGPLTGSIGPPAFHVTICKSRTAIPAAFTLEWTDDAFRERRKRATAYPVPVVSLSSGRSAVPAAAREELALPGPRAGAAADLQPAREQYPEDRRIRRAGQ